MGFKRILWRSVLAVAGTLTLVVGTAAAVLAHPEPLYPYHVTEGRLSLYGDRPFTAAEGEALLTEVERRISLSPLDRPEVSHAIFVSNAEWRRRLTFLWHYGAGGLNYYPLTRNVFIRQADIAADQVYRANGEPVPPPRTLAYYAAHEIGHSLVGMRIGGFANQRLPQWIREGVADYIGFGGAVDVKALTAELVANGHMRPSPPLDYYAGYRLLVAYFLKREGWSIDRLLASGMSQAEAERRMIVGTAG